MQSAYLSVKWMNVQKKCIHEYIQNKFAYETLQPASMDVVSNHQTGLQQQESPHKKSCLVKPAQSQRSPHPQAEQPCHGTPACSAEPFKNNVSPTRE